MVNSLNRIRFQKRPNGLAAMHAISRARNRTTATLLASGNAEEAKNMLIKVYASRGDDGIFTVSAPLLENCQVSDSALDRALTKIHLAIEGRISDLLIRNEPMPEESARMTKQTNADPSSCDAYDIHINIVHLTAVADHQKASGAKS